MAKNANLDMDQVFGRTLTGAAVEWLDYNWHAFWYDFESKWQYLEDYPELQAVLKYVQEDFDRWYDEQMWIEHHRHQAPLSDWR